ncbi:MAG TPA: hypothetical protein ENG95_05550 [Nitrospirae bacterium]|nr:hypothetical protein [Nitrospirota bacterium]
MRKKKIEFIGENNVEVTYADKVKDTNNNEFEVWDIQNTKSYGQDVVDEERKAHNEALVEAKNFDVKQYKADMIKRIEDNLVVLDEVQVELDKGLNEKN